MAVGLLVRDETVTLKRLRFHYREWENPGTPPLLLLHGVTSQARDWDEFAAAMQQHYRVLALDQRGHGETDWAADYRTEQMADDVRAFVEALDLRRIALLGFSMGGRNAYTYTALHPQDVERLVVVDIGPESGRRPNAPAGEQPAVPDLFDDPEDAVQAVRAATPRFQSLAALRARVRKNLIQRPDGRWTWCYDGRLRAPGWCLPCPEPAVQWGLIERITCPTLLVRGAESDVLSRATAERMARVMPDCRLVEVSGSGHPVPMEDPDGFLAAVRPFLEDERGSRRER